jgi:hypothetical protein
MNNAKKKALESKLDGRQIRAALMLVERDFTVDEEGRQSLEAIAEEVGVTRLTLYNWRTQKAAFIEYVNLLADDFLSSHRPLVYRQLMKTINGAQPSVKGIDLYFKRFGLITERQIVETKDTGSSRTNEDIAAEIAEMGELLADGNDE